MSKILPFLIQHGYAVVFAGVLAEQVGLPIPAAPILLAVGALAGLRRFSFSEALALASAAAVIADLAWYELGRRRGYSILKLMCRISLEPDSCVRRTEDRFARHGGRLLLFAKFVPGLGAAATAIAGLLRMRPSRFLAWDAAGSLLWTGVFIGAGYTFSPELDQLGLYAGRLGAGLVVLLAAGIAAYIGWKYRERQRFIRDLRIARITPAELARKMKAGEDIVVLDLRSSLDFEADSTKIQGAIHMFPAEVVERYQEIPRDRDVVLYCT
jgi:membrane protein DedA with SNARE-associated domain